MLFAEPAIFVHFQSVRIILFVLHGIIISLLAFRTCQCNFCSHDFSSYDYRYISFCVRKKKDLPYRHSLIYHNKTNSSSKFFNFFRIFLNQSLYRVVLYVKTRFPCFCSFSYIIKKTSYRQLSKEKKYDILYK